MSSVKLLDINTAKFLSATQVITTPLSAVKELIENSLDARATIISIEISANVVDLIQVRDNGHGIAPGDRSICCRRHTTSKLSSVAELRVIGGMSLGFRGEALFALAQVTEKMEVTTRVEGESTAVKLSINTGGEVTGRSTASHQIGTTVRLTDFFGKIPVRKQIAEKNASNCLASIRKLLQAHALARPNVRMQLRVLRTKREKSNFCYSPKTSAATVRDAAFKIIGTEAASQCSWSVLESERFKVQALLPIPGAVPTKISNVGHFLSIDQRPVSTSRGLFKHVTKRVLEMIRASSDALSSVKDPFFVINIGCPLGSYDPNVEPAKDDVIFDDGEEVLKAVDELLNAVYSNSLQRAIIEDVSASDNINQRAKIEEHAASEQTLPGKQSIKEIFDDDDDFEALEDNPNSHLQTAGECAYAEDGGHLETENAVVDVEALTPASLANTDELGALKSSPNVWRSGMYSCDEDDLELFEIAEEPRPASANVEPLRDDRRSLNPWIIAKMNVSVKPKVAGRTDHALAQLSRACSLSPTPSRRSYINQGERLPTSTPSDGMQLPSLPWQSPASINRPSVGDPMVAAQGRPEPARPSGLPTPLPSSSPVHHNAQLHQTRAQRQRQTNRNQPVKKAFTPLLRYPKIDTEDYTPGPLRCPKPLQNPRQDNRDLREVWAGPASVSQNAALVSQSEPSEIVLSDKQIEDDFRARLLQAGDELSSQYAQRIMACKLEAKDQNMPHNASKALHKTWTPINTTRQPIDKHGPHSTTNLRQTTESRLTKSSWLPLERVPDTYHTHSIVQHVSVTAVKLESLIYFSGDTVIDLEYGMPVEHQHNLVDSLPDLVLVQFGIKAVGMLRQRLREAERSNDEETAPSFAGTIARLEKTSDDDDMA